jgi:rhodanese-related sulfurtransferase
VVTAQPLSTSGIPYPDVPRISLQETTEKLEQGQAVLVDVRSRASYDKAHATGALSMPEEELDARLNELPRDQELVLY